jgi:uncharacterized protein YndB with AHSA1/START domain
VNEQIHTLELDVSPAQVFLSLNNASELSAWLCNDARIRAAVGGHALIINNDPPLAYAGLVTEVEIDTRIAYDLTRLDGAGRLELRAEIAEQGGGSLLTLTVRSSDGDALGALVEGRLRHLTALLETGYDLRISELPLIGVMPGPRLDAEALRERGIEAEQGLAILGAVPGLSADRAGLAGGDALLEAAGSPLASWSDFQVVVRSHGVGASVPLRFGRDGSERDVDLELLPRPMPTVPTSADEAALAALALKAPLDRELDALVAGVSEAEAAARPADDAWCANEVIAHLINAERDHQILLTSVLISNRLRVFSNNHPARVAATVERYRRLDALVDALHASHAETIALYRNLPSDALQRKSALVICLMIEEGGTYHTRHHFAQLRRAVDSARAAIAT